MQVASVGLVKAIDRSIPTRDGVLDLRGADDPRRAEALLPRLRLGRARAPRDAGAGDELDQAVEALHRKLGRSPSTKEVAAELGQTEEEVLEAIEAHSAYDAVSLEQHRSDDPQGGDTYADTLATEEERYELVEYEATIAPTLKALPPRDRLILHLRFSEDLTQSEIAERIGVSQMHVSRLIRRALSRLRAVASATETEQ